MNVNIKLDNDMTISEFNQFQEDLEKWIKSKWDHVVIEMSAYEETTPIFFRGPHTQ
jgi:hypothetical protein